MLSKWTRRVAIALTLGLNPGALMATPDRVVSVNVCTDQILLLLADPGQIMGLSQLAADPEYSVNADTAKSYPAIPTNAEDIFTLAPDLVVAGTFTSPATIRMLRRLGIRVETFPPASSFDDIRNNIRRMGDILGKTERAETLIETFDAHRAALRDDLDRGLAALYAPNGWSAGSKTLAGEIIDAAGYDNAADTLGYPSGGLVPLESLVMLAPDLLISGSPGRSDSRAHELLTHPALDAMNARRLSDRGPEWVCGTPDALNAVRALRRAAE